MKSCKTIICISLISVSVSLLLAQCETISFEKAVNSDWTLPENQDSLSPTVIITRKNSGSLYNIAQEDGYDGSGTRGSPVGTLWARKSTADASLEDYVDFVTMHDHHAANIIGETLSLYLPDDIRYFDVVFSSYISGGGYAYTRTCIQSELSKFNIAKPDKYSIHNIYPNPFNPLTNIQYSLPVNTDVELVVYDIAGRQIQTLISNFKTAGYHSINWNASNYPSGVYLIRMDSGEFTQIHKVVLVK